MNDTFKTGVDLETSWERIDLSLPSVVNFVALRETFLSEAPFVTRTNRSFWKKWIDSRQYTNVFAASLNFISACLGENGSISIIKLNNIQDNGYIHEMSANISAMMLVNNAKRSNSHDLLFKRLPELLCYMVANSLQSCAPRNSRVFNSCGFREILLDWFSELVGGLRLTNCRSGREWLFDNANDANIVVCEDESRAHAMKNASAAEKDSTCNVGLDNEEGCSTVRSVPLPSLGSAVSQFAIDNSPLMNIYLNMSRTTPYVCAHSLKVKLSHKPERPITTIRSDCTLTDGAFRERKIVTDQLRQSMQLSSVHRRAILSQHALSRKMAADETLRIRQSGRMQMSMIGSKTVTNKQLLAVAALDSASVDGGPFAK